MLQTLTPAITHDPAGAAPVEVTVTLTPAVRLSAYVTARAERDRRAQTAAVRALDWLPRRLGTLRAVLAAALVVAVLALHRLRPDLIPPGGMWVLTWAPLVLLTLTWWAALPVMGWAGAASMGKHLNPGFRRDAPAEDLHVRLWSGEVEAASASRRFQALNAPHHTAVETPDAFMIVLDDAVLPIPKHGLDGPAIASLRAKLRHWRLREAPPRPSMAVALLTAILCVGGIGLGARLTPADAQPAAVAARRTPGQATIQLTDRSMRLDGSRASIEDERYLVWMVDGQMYDQLRGTIKLRAVEGRFWLGRHAPGNTARTPEAELRNLQQTVAGNEPVPDDAAVTVLPDSGVLVTWPDNQGYGACAALRTYRDQVPAEALPAGVTAAHYRRNLLLRFCARAMSAPTLGDWLVAAAPTFYAEFNAAVRP